MWAGTGLVLADEFRDGNVPDGTIPLAVVKVAFKALPAMVTEFACRADRTSHNHDLKNWLRDEARPDGP